MCEKQKGLKETENNSKNYPWDQEPVGMPGAGTSTLVDKVVNTEKKDEEKKENDVGWNKHL